MRRIIAIVGLSTVVSAVALVGRPHRRSPRKNACRVMPWWHLTSSVRPAVLPSGGEGLIVVQATNIGNAPTSGPISLSATLPAGLSVAMKGATPQIFFDNESKAAQLAAELCKVDGATVTCTTSPSAHNTQSNLEHVVPYETVEVWVKVDDTGATPGSEYPRRSEWRRSGYRYAS